MNTYTRSSWWKVRQIRLGDTSFPYHYGHDCLDQIVGALAVHAPDRFFVVTDTTVEKLHGEMFISGLRRHAPVHVIALPPGEQIKSFDTLATSLEEMIVAGASRRSLVVAFGGGVPGNLAGLLAGLLFRGIRFVHVPTTTIAAADSAISLKQAINSNRYKNAIGTYHAPMAVYLDINLLLTLPDRHLKSGMGEAVKNCLAIRPGALPALQAKMREAAFGSPQTLLWLLEESLDAKLAVTAKDRTEQVDGLVLEYGHTVGHAIEQCGHRIKGADCIPHGESVALGLAVAARIASKLGLLSDANVALHDELVGMICPLQIPNGVTVDDIMQIVRMDNKRGHLGLPAEELAFVLLGGLGKPILTDGRPLTAVPIGLVEEVLTEFASYPARQQQTAPLR